MILPVILSGGSGTRLWPLSRKLHPKQFLPLINETTLFQDTILRLPKGLSNPIIICNEEHRFLAAEQIREINKKTKGIILEPGPKNTAPAVTLAALMSTTNQEDPILLVLSSDHLIENIPKFHNAINTARKIAEDNKLVTFGIEPTRIETGYGYIEKELNVTAEYSNIKSFTEKPNLATAKKFYDSGNYLWNSGIFMFKASVFLSELKKFDPEILLACEKSLKNSKIDLDFFRIDNDEFDKCPNKSIDYALMEKTKNGVVISLDSNWSDVGTWPSLWEVKSKDKNDNVVEGNVLLENTNNTFISSSNRLVSVIGVSNQVIIDTQDALLVMDKDQTHNFKKILNKLQKDDYGELESHRKVYRPWGYYDSLDSSEDFKVKRIVVNSGSKLSLQKHQYRAEHWVVVKGIALVTCDDKVFELTENQSTYIPQGSLHRLENQQDTALEIIEIQTGSYFGEDDIYRLKDDYKRK
tara:strand:- start:3967 stop:5370 length:1404 start_codon:yes stop_codon:yes gene_type:complete